MFDTAVPKWGVADEDTLVNWIVEHEQDIAKALPGLLSDDVAIINQAVAGLLGTAVGGAAGSAVAVGLAKRLQTWARENSATRKLVLADQEEDRRADRERAIQDVLHWLRRTIVEEVSRTEKYEHTQTRLLVSQGHDTTHAALTEIKGMLQVRVGGSVSGDEKLNVQLDGTRDLLTARDPMAARRQLAQIEASGMLADASPQVRCRWFNQSGMAQFELGEIATAIRYLECALVLDPLNLTALANLAVAYGANGQTSEAAATSRRATQSHPVDPTAWAVRIQCDADFDSSEVPSAVLEATQVREAHAIRCIVDGKLQAAAAQLRQMLHGDPLGHHHVLLGKALWGLLDAKVNNPSEQAELLEELTSVLREAVRLIPQTNSTLRQDALAMLGGALRRADSASEAIGAFTSALELAPQRVDLVHELAQAHLAVGSPVEAGRVLNALDAAQKTALTHGLLAEISAGAGDKDAALAHARRGVAMLSEAGLSEEAVRLATVVLELRDLELARLIAIRISSEPANVNARVLLARLAHVRGNEDEAVAHYQAALTLAREPGIAVEYAAYLRRIGNFKAALSMLEDFRSQLSDAGVQLYVESAYLAGELSRAHEAVEELWERGRRDLWLLRLRVTIASARDSTSTAIATLREWVRVAPTNVEPAGNLAQFCIRAGEYGEADQILQRLRAEYTLNAEDSLRVAELHIQRQLLDDARLLAWKGLRLAPHSSAMQHAYLSLYSAFRIRDGEEAIAKAAPGVGVQWVDEDSLVHTHYLADECPSKDEFGEIDPSSPFARAVLGLGVGSTFVLEEGTPYRRSGTIQALMSKQSYGFVWVTGRLSANPTSSALRTLSVGKTEEAPFASIERILRDQEQSTEALLDIYMQHALPLGILAGAQHKRIVDVYGRIAGSAGRWLIVEFPDHKRRAAAVDACKAQTVIVTRSGLVTAAALNLLSFVEQLPGNLVAPQALLDELALERRRLVETAAEGRKAVGYHDGRMVLHETSADEGKRLLAQHDALVVWIRDNVQIVPIPLGVILPQADLWEKMGDESCAAARIGVDAKAAVYADDLGYRIVLETMGVGGFSSFAMLLWARSAGAISADDLRHKVIALLQLSHFFIPVDGDILMSAFADSGYKPSPGLRLVLRHLQGSSCELGGAVQVAAGAMRDLLLRETVAGANRDLLILLLEAVFGERESSKVHAALTEELRRACRLLPMHLETLLSLVDTFTRTRSGESPIII